VTTSAFVTGDSGFIGGALVRRLVADGWTVRALTRGDAWLSAVETTIDSTRARTELGYAPVRTIDEGLEELRQP
jgi:nucleoside-diphosphate-sugar epimerase